MSSPFASSQPRVLTCGETQCNSRGTCVVPLGGGADLVCNCQLGYEGDFCQNTVNGSLSVPLTLSVLGVLIGLLILAFVIARVRQKQRKKQRGIMEAKHGYSNAV